MGGNASLAEGRLELGLAGGGSLRWAVAEVTALIEEMRSRLDLYPVPTAALGRALTGAALLLRLATKTPTRLVLEIAGDGPLRRVLAEADDEGNLRGLVGDGQADVPDRPDRKLAVGDAVGRGHLRVLREYPRGSYQSQVELVSGEISEDLSHYLAQSEQTRSAVLLGVLTRPTGVAAAGGLIVEVLPGATEEALATLEGNLAGIAGVSRLVEEGGTDEVLGRVLAGLDPVVHEVRSLHYRCRCNRERLRRQLATLPEADRSELAAEGGTIAAECAYCGSVYHFSLEDLADREEPGAAVS